MQLDRRHFVISGAACLALAAGRAPVAAAPDWPSEITYTVLREGTSVGRHVTTFGRDAGLLVVRNDIELTVSFLGITLYRYDHVSEERWDGDRLVALDSRTSKNGTDKRLQGRRDGDGPLVLSNQDDERRSFVESPMTTALWHPETPRQSRLLEIEDGWMKPMAAETLGASAVAVAGRERAATHFRLGGEVDRDVWYDEDGRLLQVAFKASMDGSRIVVRAERIEPAGRFPPRPVPGTGYGNRRAPRWRTRRCGASAIPTRWSANTGTGRCSCGRSRRPWARWC